MRALILAPFSTAYLEQLRRQVDVVYESWLDTNTLQDPEELGRRLAVEDIAVLIVEADFVFEEVFDAAPGLRLVGVCRNALNQVDILSATAHGVAVSHAPGRNTNAVAEMTLGLMLSLARGILQAATLVAGAGWREPSVGYRLFRGREIAGATVGVVGFGQIGREVARKCIALDAHVLAHDPYVAERDIRAFGAEPVPLADIAALSDFLTLHVPEEEATYRLIDASFLQRMKPEAYLINTGAGASVDAQALATALASRRLAGAALDVFDGHPLPASSSLASAPNVILTPHIGGATAETIERHSLMMTEEIERLLAGEPLQHVVNPDYLLARAR
ncbi:MAG: NAD(P)-binding domain-containing protein [Chloroflexota bacterium]|nr:NAD(P)-binding domain-containing protein [Chloroflexota bacterium]